MSSLFWGFNPVRPGASSPGEAASAAIDKQHAERAAREVREYEERLDKLTLICMALWSLLQEKADLTDDDLLERVRQIDLMDGKEDGKAKKQIAKCPQCGRSMSARHGRCLYCGARGLEYSAFDAVR
ncbi:MAG TPA: hypothetical protein VM031_07370 [Phycisphaerae bacterium]|nr:hypothetical protein [Phycisphaerae bacterium]